MGNVFSLASIVLVLLVSSPLYARFLSTANRAQPQTVQQKPAEPSKPPKAESPDDKVSRTSVLKRFRELANKCDAKARGVSPEPARREGEELQ